MASTLRFDNWENSNGDSIASASGGFLSSPGSVLQIVSVTKGDPFSASVASASSVDITGLEASITPKSTSSKILIFGSVNGTLNINDTTFYGAGFEISRDDVEIGSADIAGSRNSVHANSGGEWTDLNTLPGNAAINFLDSPNTTNEIVYKVKVVNASSSTRTIIVNRTFGDSDVPQRQRSTCTITLMEIAG